MLLDSVKKQILIAIVTIAVLLLTTAKFGFTTIDPIGLVEATGSRTTVPVSKISTTDYIEFPNITTPPSKLTDKTPPFVSKSALIFDLKSKTTLESKNEFSKREIASITKLMTVLVSKKYINQGTQIIVPSYIEQIIGSNMDLEPGESLSYNDLIKGMLITSANDAAITIGSYLKNNQNINVVKEMNNEADKIGMSSTSFDNPVGFDSPQNYSTVHDLKKLVIIAMQDKDITNIVKTHKVVISSDKKYHYIKNTNKLLFKDQRVNGLKTGTTNEAGESLILTAEMNKHTIVIILLDSPDRFEEASNLISWLEENYDLE